MSKTFDYSINFLHGEGSRVSNKVLKSLKANQAFKVTRIFTPPHLRQYDDQPQQSSIKLKDKEHVGKLNFLINEIVAELPELFPKNYSFRIFRNSSGIPFGYKLEFALFTPYNNEMGYAKFYCKINEVNKNSAPITNYDIKVEG